METIFINYLGTRTLKYFLTVNNNVITHILRKIPQKHIHRDSLIDLKIIQ